LDRCDLPECPVWARGVEMVEVGGEEDSHLSG
jgi:hypothetical protein